MRHGNFHEAAIHFRNFILRGSIGATEEASFKGYGNIENWRFCGFPSPMEWLTTIWKEEQESLNRFDLLNIANALRLHQDAGRASEIIGDYEELNRQGERT
jgi:hypothetical protein